MIDPAQLAALAAILATGSFDGAAATLNVTQSAISQRIRALEERMGTVLILRGQPCLGTEAGLRLARHREDIALLEQALARDLKGVEADRPSLRIAVNADSLATWFLPALTALPNALFDLVIDDQDHSAALLRRAEVTAAVTVRAAAVQGCTAWPLGALRYVATASPGFVARHFAGGVDGSALMRAPMLTFNAKDQLQRRWLRALAGRDLAPPAHVIGSSTGFVDAALLGLGWGMNPEGLVRDHVAAGRLVALVPDRPLDVALCWQVARLNGAALVPLTQAVRRAAKAALIGP